MHCRLDNLTCASALALSLYALCITPAAAAPFKIYSPIVHEGETAIEYRGYRDGDRRSGINHAQTQKLAVEYGVTSYWMTEIEGEFEKEGGAALKGTAVEWENVFQLTPQGRYWLDAGIFAEYEFGTRGGSADKIKLGPLLEKEFGPRLSATFNAFVEHEVGRNAAPGTTLSYGARVKYNVNRYIQPALEAFGEPGLLGNMPARNDQEHWIGPALYGSVKMARGHVLNYRAAALFGTTTAASDHRMVLQMEYEF